MLSPACRQKKSIQSRCRRNSDVREAENCGSLEAPSTGLPPCSRVMGSAASRRVFARTQHCGSWPDTVFGSIIHPNIISCLRSDLIVPLLCLLPLRRLPGGSRKRKAGILTSTSPLQSLVAHRFPKHGFQQLKYPPAECIRHAHPNSSGVPCFFATTIAI